MKVTLIADSCFLFEHHGIKLLTDPWIGGTVYDGAWLQYPAPIIQPQAVGRLDYIFISHIHEDHCDLKTLRELDRSAKVIIMKRSPNFVKRFLLYHDLDFSEIIELPIREQYHAGPNLHLEVVEANPSHTLNHLIDSSLIIHFNDKSIYFANDNPPYPEIDDYLSKYDFELALLPPAGGSGYPACYENLTDAQKREKAYCIYMQYHDEMLNCLRRLKPSLFGCAANGHVLSGRSFNLNEFMAWPKSSASPYRYIKKCRLTHDTFRAILQLPGYTIDLDHEEGVTDEEAISFYEDAVKKHNFIMQEAVGATHSFEKIVLNPSISFSHLISLASQRLLSYLRRSNINLIWCYVIQYSKTEYAIIELHPPYRLRLGVHQSKIPERNRLVISTDLRLLFLLLTGGFSWNIADATGFVRYHRVPDDYIFDVYIALNHLRI